MLQAPAVIVHGLDHAIAALRPGLPVLLLSAPGAVSYAGCGWWRALMEAARSAAPMAMFDDILDCGAAPGLAMAALRIGQIRLVLSPACPAFAAVAGAATSLGAVVLPVAPAALDLNASGGVRRLPDWLRDDTPGGLV